MTTLGIIITGGIVAWAILSGVVALAFGKAIKIRDNRDDKKESK